MIWPSVILPLNKKNKRCAQVQRHFLNPSEMGFILFLVEHLYLIPGVDGFILSHKYVNDEVWMPGPSCGFVVIFKKFPNDVKPAENFPSWPHFC